MKNVFACSKHSKFESGQFLFFSNVFFKKQCAPILLKIEKDFDKFFDLKTKRI
jgi:hypothetical protein